MKFVWLMVCLSLVACSGQAGRVQIKPGPFKAKISSEDGEDRVETVNLNMAQTGQALSDVSSNAVPLKGVGLKSTYKVKYKFHSGNQTRFQVIRSSLNSSSTGCAEPKSKLLLKTDETAQKVEVGRQIDLDANTEYVLEMSAEHECEKLEVTFDVIAWVGSSTVDPKIASVCEGQKNPQVTFFGGVNFVTAFSSLTGKEKFLNSGTFCGEVFEGVGEKKCHGAVDPFSPIHSTSSQVECTSQIDAESKSWIAKFDLESRTAKVVCKTGDIENYIEDFKDCRDMVLDYGVFQKLTP